IDMSIRVAFRFFPLLKSIILLFGNLIDRYLVVYNPFEQERDSVVSICVNSATVQVLSDSGKPMEIQVSAVWNDARTVSQTAYE
ncbi:hypothetical protein A6R68_09938, partial [Neotoma lepida]